MKKVFLVMVTDSNNNKFYQMVDNGNGTFTVTYGRVEKTAQTETYPISKWDTKYKEKLKKGYKDVTEYKAVKVTQNDGVVFTDITNSEVASLIKDLQNYSNKSIKENYSVEAKAVTQKQVDDAQNVLNSLVQSAKLNNNTKVINTLLLDLFHIIPRNMKNVKDELFPIQTINTSLLKSIEEKINKEQATLDVMAQAVKQQNQITQQTQTTKNINILDILGVTIEPTVKGEDDMIKKMMGSDANLFSRAFKVISKNTQPRFDAYLNKANNKKTELFWHGSRNENWLSIIETGLVLRPTNAVISGKMFGYGTYFADKFKKSLGYTSHRGSYWARGNSNKAYLALFQVHVGNQLHIKKHESWCYDLNETNLKKRGNYDSLFAEGGIDLRNNEYIVYNENQCTIKYIVEIQS